MNGPTAEPPSAADLRPRRPAVTRDNLAAQVLERVRSWRPGAAPARIVYLGEGDFCTAFLLDGHLVARVGKHAEADGALGREARLLSRLPPLLPLPVPAPTLLPEATADGHVIAVHEQIAGAELLPELWAAMAEPARSRCARELGVFLSRLHALDPEVARSCGAVTLDHGAEARVCRDHIRRLGETLLPASAARRADGALARYQAGGDVWAFEPALVHGDLSPGHVLLRPDATALAGIIDWGDARIGDPARDFVFLYEDWGTPFLDAVLAHYATAHVERLTRRIHLQFVLAHLDWMIDAARARRWSDLRSGAGTLARALDDLEGDLA